MRRSRRLLSSALAILMAVSMIPSDITVYADEASHVHSDSCYTLTCDQEENHTHDDSCYEISRTLTCGKDGEEGHEHSDDCYDETRTLTCDKAENHTHDDSCKTLTCTEGSGSTGDDGSDQGGQTGDDASKGDSATGGDTSGAGDTSNAGDTSTSGDGSSQSDKSGEGETIVEPTDGADIDDVPGDEDETDDVLALPETEEPLTKILGKDSDDNYKMYTTLYDDKGRVVDTNDPKYEKDNYYKSKDDGGEDGTVDIDTALDVRFRMAEIIANEDDGVQEKVTYYSDTLPTQLVPADEDGTLLNPETPVQFVQTEGDIEAYGGLYGSKEDGYQFKVFFRNVVERLDISGSYQYGATINTDEVKKGDTVQLNYGPAGTVSFKVTPEEEKPKAAAYTLKLEGTSDRSTVKLFNYWKATIERSSDAEASETVFPYRELTLSNDEGVGYWINTADQTIFDGYGDFKSRGSDNAAMYINVTYLNEDGSTSSKKLTASKDDILGETEEGETVIRFSDVDHLLQIDLSFRKSDAELLSVNSSKGNISYLTRTVRATISNGDSGDAENIQKIEFRIPVLQYDDYKKYGYSYNGYTYSSKSSYSGRASLTTGSEESAEIKDISATGRLSITDPLLYPDIQYTYSPGGNYITFGSVNGYSFGQRLYVSPSDSMNGSYYQLTYTPDVEDNQSFKKYNTNAAFVENGTLVDSDYYQINGLFRSLSITDYGSSNSQIQDWVYAGSIRIANLSMAFNNSDGCFKESQGDARLHYQLLSIFYPMGNNRTYSVTDEFIVYRSQNKTSEGRYIYIVVDPLTHRKAVKNQEQGWNEYTETNSTRPGSWTLHIFNVPHTYGAMVAAELYSYEGTVVNEVVTQTGKSQPTQDKLTVGTTASNQSSKTYTGSDYIESDAVMNATWVDEDTIYWEMTIGTARWPEWKDGKLHVNAGSGMTFYEKGETVTVDGQQLDTSKLYVNDRNKAKNVNQTSWTAVGSLASSSVSKGGSGASINKITSDPTFDTVSGDHVGTYDYAVSNGWQKSGYRMIQSGSNPYSNITIGFFTKVTGAVADDEYAVTAQYVVQSGDISGLGVYKGYYDSSVSLSKRFDPQGQQTQYPIKITTKASTTVPTISKSGKIDDKAEGLYKGVVTDWTLSVDDIYPSTYVGQVPSNGGTPGINATSILRDKGVYGGYCGTLYLADTMQNSTATGSQGEDLVDGNDDLNPAKYTYVTSIFEDRFTIPSGSSSMTFCAIPTTSSMGNTWAGFWYRYTSSGFQVIHGGNYQTYGWDPKSPGIYRSVTMRGEWNNTYEGMQAFVYYAGNMQDSVADALGSELKALGVDASQDVFQNNSLVIEFRNVRHLSDKTKVAGYDVSFPTDWTYTTELDSSAYLSALAGTEDPTTSAYANVSLKNSASSGNWKFTEKDDATATVTKRVAMYLGIEKKVQGLTSDKSKTSAKYDLTVTTGSSGAEAPDLSVEDYILEFNNASMKGEILSDGKYTADANPEIIKALTSHLSVKDLKIVMTEKDGTETTIYANGKFIAGWNTYSTLQLLTDKGYTSERHPNGSLFQAVLQPDEGAIANDTSFTFSYNMVLDTDKTKDSNGKTFRESDYYQGEGVQIGNGASASRSLVSTTSRNKSKARKMSGRQTDQTLSVDSGAVATSTMLTDPQVSKEYNEQNANKWKAQAYTGTTGKDDDAGTIELTDRMSYALSNLVYTTEDGTSIDTKNLSETQRDAVRALMEQIIERHTAYTNIQISLQEGTDGNTETLWALSQRVTIDGTKIVSADRATADGINLNTLQLQSADKAKELRKTYTITRQDGETYTGTLTLQNQPAQLGYVTEEGRQQNLAHEHGGLTLTATGLPYDSHLTLTYDLETDWEAVEKEAAKIFGAYSISGTAGNSLKDSKGHEDNANGAKTEIASMSVGKSVKGQSAAGNATWTINANTGSMSGNEITISDAMSIALPKDTEEGAQTIADKAAQKATSIDADSMTIKLGSTTIYEKGALTDAASNSGWTSNNLAITIDGVEFKIVIKNIEDHKVLDKNQAYEVTYQTVLDKAAYVQNGGKAGDSYVISNKVSLSGDGTMVNADSESKFKPNIPIEAKKAFDGPNANLASWTVTAGTGDAAREHFVLTDTISFKRDGEEQARIADLAAQATVLRSMTIKVATGDPEDKENYTENTFTPENLPEGVTLTTADGEAFALNQVGVLSYQLTFDQLPKNTTITVQYTAAVDREQYLQLGGNDGDVISMGNAFEAATADGYTGKDSKDGKATIDQPYSKTGSITTETNKETGNPILAWSLNVSLSQTYTEAELAKLTEVTLTDDLSPVLAYIDESLQVTDPAGNAVPFTLEKNGQKLQITIQNPAEHPNVVLTFKTECQYSMDSLVNEAAISINGKTVKKIESPDIGEIHANGQKGTIRSAKVPSYVPTASKYYDNEICTTAGKYLFELVEVDENYNVLTGEKAYRDTARNDENGKITFKEIKFSDRPAAGVTVSHYYQIREIGEAPEDVILDTRVFIIRVDITHVSGGYLVTETVVAPESYADVRFDNTTKPKTTRYTVTKVWNDSNNASGKRPSQILVHLYQDGKPYNNIIVTLSPSNNWTYTWENLPIAGGDYSAVEESVDGYTGSSTVTKDKTTLTNTLIEESPKDDNPGGGDGGDDRPKSPNGGSTEVTEYGDESVVEITESGDDSTVEITEFGDETTETPGGRTGDSSRMELWILLAILSGAICIISGKRLIRRR